MITKKIFKILALISVCMMLCSCQTKEQKEAINVYKKPSMDIYIEEEPLVLRELVYNNEGVRLCTYTYEYDEFNRLSKQVYEVNDDTTEVTGPVFTYNYSYDDQFMYMDIIYHRIGDAKATKIFDAREDEIQTQFYTEDGELMSANTNFEYSFEKNTVIKKTWAEDPTKNYSIYKSVYDDRGNEIIHERQDYDEEGNASDRYPSCDIYNYEYDIDGKILKCVHNSDTSITEIINSYDLNNKLIEKDFVTYKNSEDQAVGIVADLKKHKYEYDSLGRLIKEYQYRNCSEPENNNDDYMVYVYEYE